MKLIKKSCLKCNRDFSTRDNRRKFCSSSCSAAYINQVHFVYVDGSTKKNCVICEKEFFTFRDRTKVCSQKCRDISTSKRTLNERISKVRTCHICGNEFKNQSRVKTCSPECGHEYKYRKYIKRYISGKENGTSGNSGGCVPRVKRYILERDNHQCVECGQTEIWNGKSLSLHVDHIDGNRYNNKPENLRTLCPNCHTQTETYGSKNMKK